MSQENVELVRRMIEAAQRGDWQAALSGYDPGVVLDQTRMPDGGIYHGHDGVREFYRRWFGSWDEFHIEHKRLVDAGDQVVDVNEVSGRGKGSGVPVRMRTANVLTIQRGAVIRHVGYLDVREALEAAGLRQ
jgi:ketosteroid isomerase-like protein